MTRSSAARCQLSRGTAAGVVAAIMLVVLAVGLSSCAQFHTRLFQQKSDQAHCFRQYCFYPRIVAYEDIFGPEPEGKSDNGFWTTIKVYDTTINAARYHHSDSVKNVDTERRRMLGDEFKTRMIETIRMDSLVLVLPDNDEKIIVYPDTSRYEPRDVNYISYFFGRVTIGPTVDQLDAVYYYSYLGGDDDNRSVESQSASFAMERIEESGLVGGIEEVLYRDENDTTDTE